MGEKMIIPMCIIAQTARNCKFVIFGRCQRIRAAIAGVGKMARRHISPAPSGRCTINDQGAQKPGGLPSETPPGAGAGRVFGVMPAENRATSPNPFPTPAVAYRQIESNGFCCGRVGSRYKAGGHQVVLLQLNIH